MGYSKEFLQETIKVWQPYSKELLTEEDAREITQNSVALFRLLIKLDKKFNVNEEKPPTEPSNIMQAL